MTSQYPHELIVGEFRRTLDDRHRLSLPAELLDPLLGDAATAVLAKERAGCLSLWNADRWRSQHESGVRILQQKLLAGKFADRTAEVQRLARLLSSRHTQAPLARRGRLVIPEGFREFLDVEPGGDIMVVGAGLCVELWQPAAWHLQLTAELPNFRQLFDQLSG